MGGHYMGVGMDSVSVDSVWADIMSEPEVVADTLDEGDRRLPHLAARWLAREIGTVYAFGAGTSNFAGLSGRYALERWAGIPTLPFSSIDFQLYALPAAGDDAVGVAISQSGETIETVVAARAAKERGMSLVALTNDADSRLGRLCDGVILLRAGHEEGPGTKTVVAQCVAIYQFALHLALASGRGREEVVRAALAELRAAPQAIQDMLSEPATARLERLAETLAGEEVLYIIGAGPFSALALQAANYLREVAKIHCCPFEATEFRHGPLEALSGRSRLLVLSNGACRAREQVERACRGAADAGARLVYVGDEDGLPGVPVDDQILLPALSELLAAQVYLSPIQLLGYCTAKRKGLDPTHFDHIVKTWVE
jgi:glucosamine--fructose-6-phosphate aminotransferase (isomerizing)